MSIRLPGCRDFDGSFLGIHGHDTQGHKHAKGNQRSVILLAGRTVRHWTLDLAVLAFSPIPLAAACGTLVRQTVSETVNAHHPRSGLL
jgi:hypothetical protein